MALDPTQQDAYSRIQSFLDGFGLGSLANKVLGYVQDGLSEDSIMLELQNTPEWKSRFSANQQRLAKGLPVLTPAEYISIEQSYRQILQQAGVPSGFYDQQSDFTKFIAEDVSPAELQDRVKVATDFVNAADPAQLAQFRQWYSEGDIIAYALDSKRAAPLVGKQLQAASVAGIAQDNGLHLGQLTAEQLAAAGVTDQQARSGFNQLGQAQHALDTLAAIDQQQPLTGDQLAQATFLGDQQATDQIKKLKSRERARFQGSSGIGQDSLSSGTSGL